MATRLKRALFSCLLIQSFAASSLPMMAMDPTTLKLGPNNSLSMTIDGPLTQIDLDTVKVNVDSPKGWDQPSVSTNTFTLKANNNLPLRNEIILPAASVPISTDKADTVETVDSSTTETAVTDTPSTTVSETAKTSDAAKVQVASAEPSTVVITNGDGVLIVDNDVVNDPTLVETFTKESTDQSGHTILTSGSKFAVSCVSTHSSRTAKVNDAVEARLKNDLVIGGKTVAKRGDRVLGHVSSSAPARKMLAAEMSMKRWMRANGAVGVQFDEIINGQGEHLPLVASPARQARIVKNVNEGRILGVNANGELASPLSIQLKHQAAHLAIRGAASAGGVFSFGIVPLAYGVVGACNPSFAFMHPVGKNVRNRRLKGFAMGVVSGLPGGFLISDSIIRGQEAVIKPGDEFLAEFKQDFTGEPATDATILSGGQGKVHGQVIPKTDK